MAAAQKNSVPIFVYLHFEKGADIGSKDLRGNNILHLAAEHGSSDIVELLQQTTDVRLQQKMSKRLDVPNSAGLYPSFVAFEQGQFQVLKTLLLESPERLRHKNSQGQMLLPLMKKNQELLGWLYRKRMQLGLAELELRSDHLPMSDRAAYYA